MYLGSPSRAGFFHGLLARRHSERPGGGYSQTRKLNLRLFLQASGLVAHALEDRGGHIFREAGWQLLCDGLDSAIHFGKQLADDVLGVFAPTAFRSGCVEVASHDGCQVVVAVLSGDCHG